MGWRFEMQIYTVGHGAQSLDEFLRLLRQAGIEILVDTRTYPASSRHPQYNQRVLAKALDDAGVKYLFLGSHLGGRPKDRAMYDESGKPDYRRIAETKAYQEGISALLELARGDETVGIMCSESDFHECHRYKLIANTLASMDVEVWHILRDGSLEENPAPQLQFSI